jgi:hypothetical protein
MTYNTHTTPGLFELGVFCIIVNAWENLTTQQRGRVTYACSILLHVELLSAIFFKVKSQGRGRK